MFIGKKIIRGVKVTFRLSKVDWWEKCEEEWKISAYFPWWKYAGTVKFTVSNNLDIVKALQEVERGVSKDLEKTQEGETTLKRAKAWFKGENKND